MKRAFTLVELMVVISIIGILIAILVTNYGGATESARAAHCLANMKNLANGVQSYLGGAGCYNTSRIIGEWEQLLKETAK